MTGRGLLGKLLDDRPLDAHDHGERTAALTASRGQHEGNHDAQVRRLREQIAEAGRTRDAAIQADHDRATATHARLDRELALDAARELAPVVREWRTSTSIASAGKIAATLRDLDARARTELGEALAPDVLLAAFAPEGANLTAIAITTALSRAGEAGVPRFLAAELLGTLGHPARAFDLLARLDAACASPMPHHATDTERDRVYREHAIRSTLARAIEALDRERRGQPPLVPTFMSDGHGMRDPATGRVVGHRGSVDHPPPELPDGHVVRDATTGRVVAILNRD